MDILIKGMEIPKEGDFIVIRPEGKAYYVSANPQNAYEGKAVPVPPHGRCIDADTLSAKLNMMFAKAFGEGNTAFYFAYRSLGKVVENAPTIIPAEEE